jgi:hypothetical protein
VPTGEPPKAAIRSAVSSTISRTASTCGSSMVWTAMKFGHGVGHDFERPSFLPWSMSG